MKYFSNKFLLFLFGFCFCLLANELPRPDVPPSFSFLIENQTIFEDGFIMSFHESPILLDTIIKIVHFLALCLMQTPVTVTSTLLGILFMYMCVPSPSSSRQKLLLTYFNILSTYLRFGQIWCQYMLAESMQGCGRLCHGGPVWCFAHKESQWCPMYKMGRSST